MKKIAGIVFVFIIIISFSLFYLRSNIYDLNLLSPLVLNKQPDLTPQLQQHVTLLPELNFSKATQITTISDRISYLVFNPQNSRVYAAKNNDKIIAPASFTKLLTAQVVLDLLPPTQTFTVNATATTKEPTILGLKTDEQLTVSELLRGAISTSANDAAYLLGQGTAAQYKLDLGFFADLLNLKSRLLNLTSSHFANPEGYDDSDQYTNLNDLAKIVYNTIQNYPPIIAAGAADREDLQATTTHGFYYLPNWNGLLGIYPGVNGLKIAYTENAGYSTIVTANRQNHQVVAILTGADSIRERDLAAAALLDAAYMQEKLSPARVTAAQVNQRYHQWAELASQIRAELDKFKVEP